MKTDKQKHRQQKKKDITSDKEKKTIKVYK